MASQDPQIILYDLACNKNVCFSPAVWRIRLLLNFKQIPYKTVFLEFPDIEPTLKDLGIPLPSQPPGPHHNKPKYTVPAITHVPTNKHMMDSVPIAEFLNSTYPTPSLQPKDSLCTTLEAQARAAIGPAMYASLVPRELPVLSPRAQTFFRRTREEALGHPVEDLLKKEDAAWANAKTQMAEVEKLMETNAKKGPFVLGKEPCATDFFIAGSLEAARVVDEGIFEKLCEFASLKRVWEACEPWRERNSH